MAYVNDSEPAVGAFTNDSEPTNIATDFLLKEDGGAILLEIGDKIILTTGGSSFTLDSEPTAVGYVNDTKP